MPIRSLLHYALEIPDQSVGQRYYRDFGLADEAVRGAPGRELPVAPRRLGHVLLFSPDIDRQVDFYTRVLGMKLTDRSQKIIAFMRCTTDHHNLALLASSAPGFHHGSFEVGGVDE